MNKKNLTAGNKGAKKTYFEDAMDDEEDQDEILESSVTPKWYETQLQKDPKKFAPVTEEVLVALKDEAKKCYDAEVTSYNNKNTKANSNYRWMKTVMTKGTISDKLAAYVVTIQNNPLCSLESVRQLIGMAKVSKKKECTSVIQNLTEVFLKDLLKPNEGLKSFHERPLSQLDNLSSGNSITRRKYLCNWYFESELKELYASFILALNAVSHDTVEANKEKAVGAMYKLLAGNQEQEKNLLSYLVNKLGDPSQKIASKTIYCLTQLLFRQPIRQGVVLNEIEKLLFRSNVSTKAQYYALCFLSQFYLNHENVNIARKLIEVYFSFFKACIKKGEVNSRMMSALLMGVNRAYPYAKLELEKVSDHINTMYRVVHIANFNVALHALQLLYQVSDFSNNINDRFYSALYKKLADVKLTATTHQAILLNLIYKALLRDKEPTRVRTFIKRLLQLALMASPPFACGVLFLISNILKKQSDCNAFKLQGNGNFSNAILTEEDEDEKYLDVKEDEKPEDSIKEIPEADNLQNVTTNDAVDLNALDNKDENANKDSGPGWYHCKVKVKQEKVSKNEFNPLARNPLYAGGEYSTYVELNDLIQHFHPTVSLFATQILKGELIKYSGDPLKDFALIRFLDRFVFKNPKKNDDTNNQGAHPTFGQRKNYTAGGIKSISVKSTRYLDLEKNIPVDEMFLFNYLKSKRKNIDKTNAEGDDMESVCSEDFEKMLDKMGGKNYQDVDDDLDYLNEIGDNLKNKKGKQKNLSDDEEELSEEDMDEEEMSEEEESNINDENNFNDTKMMEEDNFDLEMNEDDKELIGDLDEDDDDSDICFDEEEEDEEDIKGNKKSKKIKFDNIFASADEFASLLEEEGSSKYAPGSSNVYSNKEKANVKQLDWEEKRNRWVKGFNKTVKNSNGHFERQKRKKFNKKKHNGSNKKHKAH